MTQTFDIVASQEYVALTKCQLLPCAKYGSLSMGAASRASPVNLNTCSLDDTSNWYDHPVACSRQ